MSGFLSKSKQRLEHTSKLNVGEFKQLQSLIGQEKNLLNSHVRVANDLRKASHSLDEWAQSEGPDLAVSDACTAASWLDGCSFNCLP